jgi:hypothetical protein
VVTGGGKFTQSFTTTDREGNKVTVKVVVDQAALDALKATKDSPVGKFVYKNAKRVERADKAAAPVSKNGSHGRAAGYLRSRIGTYLSQDADGPYADVTTRAKSKAAKGREAVQGPLQKGKRRSKVATSPAAYYGRIQNQQGRNKGYMRKGLGSVGG